MLLVTGDNFIRQIHYTKLQSISSQGDWDSWVNFFLTAIIEQAQSNSKKAKAILALYEWMKATVPDVTHSQYAIQAIDSFFDLPVFTSAEFIKRSGIPKASAMRILSTLQREKLLVPIRKSRGRQAAILMFHKLIEIVEE